jgi:CheY-like chemotaxis protein
MATPLVLVVEPDHDGMFILSTFIDHAGYHVARASTADAGLVAALRLRPALIVGEHPVRLADGRALCEALRADAATRDIPFLAVTSRASPCELEDARCGHYRVIVKPPDFAVLLRAIEEAVLTPA